MCGLRSKIFRQVRQKIEVRLTPCRDFFGQTDGIIFKQGVRHELCGVAFIILLCSADILAVMRALKADFFNCGIRLCKSLVKCVRRCGNAEHSAAVGIELAVLVLCAGMINDRAFNLTLFVHAEHLDTLFVRLTSRMRQRIEHQAMLLDARQVTLGSLTGRKMLVEKHRLELLSQRMEAVNPERLLSRGYSITTLNGRVVRDAAALKEGDVLVTRLEKGTVKSKVYEKGTEL